MKHYIIVKFTDETDFRALEYPVRHIFEQTLSIPGIHGIDIKLSNSDRANRYDMMIIMDMEKDALSAYDVSEPHLRWKSEYGDSVAKKAIFDCDDE
jgi:Stress responsive A/B Barrel Domain.